MYWIHESVLPRYAEDVVMRQFWQVALAAVVLLVVSGCRAVEVTSRAFRESMGLLRHDAWRIIGPGGGGAQFYPAISPHDSNLVLVGCDMTGSYLSKNGGSGWRMFCLREPARFFVWDPASPNVIYAQTSVLWRSADTGETWELVYPEPSSVAGLAMPGDHGDGWIMTTMGSFETVAALAIDPADSTILYAVMTSSRGNFLRASQDWGKSWTWLANLPSGSKAIYIDPNSPVGDRTLYVIGDTYVVSRVAGNWRQGAPTPGSTVMTQVAAGFSGGSLIIYAISARGLLISRDGGQSWVDSYASMELNAVGTSLNRGQTAYVSYGGLSEGGRTYFGVARTENAGYAWQYPWKEAGVKSPDVDDGWMSARFGPGWPGPPISLGVAPDNPNICYGSDYGRTLRTIDGGATWQAAYTHRLDDGSFTTSGLDVTTSYGVHFDPFDAKRMFISYTDIGLFVSDNGGNGWRSSTGVGVPQEWVNTTYWIEFDPEVQGRIWAVMSGTHDLPRPKMWRSRSPSSYRGGVLRSEDGGRTWRTLTVGMPQTAATHILLDRRSPAGARVLYVAGFGKGVFKSTDGGETWQAKNNGLPSYEPFAWRLAMDREGTLYLIVARRSENSSIGTDQDGALYRSRDAAQSWQKMPLPTGTNGPNGLAIDPDDPRRLYLAAWGRPSGNQAMGGGIFLSTDAGETWRQVLVRDQHTYDVTIDPRDPSLLYACGFESSAWRSADRGESWRRIRGYNFKWGHRVVPDPANIGKIYITTFGGSVWHGPAQGDDSAVEDIVSPQVLRY